MSSINELKDILSDEERSYKFGFSTDIESERPKKGLSEDTIKFISDKKNEPKWMLDWRLKAYEKWKNLEEPSWANISYPKISSS